MAKMGAPRPNPKRAEKHQHEFKARRHSQPHDSKAPTPLSSTNTVSINATKTKIRNLRRALAHASTLPAGVRIEKERAVAGYQHDLEHAVEEKKRSEMIGKYHMVRFFERRKAERALKRARAELAEGGERGGGEVEGEECNSSISERRRRRRLQQRVHAAEVDLNYTMYYPLTEKYVSLFPKGKDSAEGKDAGDDDDNDINDDKDDNDTNGNDSITPPNKPPLWTFVEQCMASNTLEKLRDGKLGVKADGSVKTTTTTTTTTGEDFASPENQRPNNDDGGGKKSTKIKSPKSAVAASNGTTTNEDDDNNSSDGGFFEE